MTRKIDKIGFNVDLQKFECDCGGEIFVKKDTMESSIFGSSFNCENCKSKLKMGEAFMLITYPLEYDLNSETLESVQKVLDKYKEKTYEEETEEEKSFLNFYIENIAGICEKTYPSQSEYKGFFRTLGYFKGD